MSGSQRSAPAGSMMSSETTPSARAAISAITKVNLGGKGAGSSGQAPGKASGKGPASQKAIEPDPKLEGML